MIAMTSNHPADIAAEAVKVRQRIKASTPPAPGERAKPRAKAPAKTEAPAPAKKPAAKKAAAKKAAAAKAAK